MSGNPSGDDWEWNNRISTGYTYPPGAHLMTVNRGGRNPRDVPAWPTRTPTAHPLAGFRVAIAAAVAATTVVVGVSLLTAAPAGTDAETAPLSSTTAPSNLGGWPGAMTAPTKTVPVNPYTDTGTWRVGTDLPPGAYIVRVTGELGGYWARCADAECRVGAGLITNDVLPTGSTSVLDIRATDYAVKTAGVELVPA